MSISPTEKNSNVTGFDATCCWCGVETYRNTHHFLQIDLCRPCQILAVQALILGRQVRQLTLKGGVQLYIAVERTGQSNELLSAHRWSPLESLESADSVEKSLSTYQLSQE